MTKALVAAAGLYAMLVTAAGACSSSTSGTPTGGLRQPCYANGTCNAGLTCASNVCVALGDGGSGSSSGSGGSSGSSSGVDSGSSSGSDSGSGSGGNDSGSSSGGDSGDGGPVLCDPSKPFGALQPITELNTAGDNAGVWLMPNQLGGYTQSTRAGAWQIFSTSRTSLTAPFSTPVAVAALNGPTPAGFNGSPSPRGDGLYILFQSNRSGMDQIWSASRASTSVDFGAPAAVAPLSSTSEDISPWLSPDGRVMYFSSNRSGTYQIWKATWGGTDFDAPTLVSEISTAGFNQWPILTPDELVVYWLTTSNIMVATRAATTDPFSNVTVVTELATLAPNGGAPVYISPDRCTIYGATRPASSTYIVKATKSP